MAKIKIIIRIIIVLTTVFTQKIYCENILNNKNDVLEIDNLFFLETEFNDGKYIKGDILKLGFKKYNWKELTNDKNPKDRMITFRSNFYLDEKLKNENLSIYTGPSNYPYNLYVNGRLIFRKGRYKDGYNSVVYYCSNIYLQEDILNYGNDLNEIAIQAFPRYENTPLSKLIISSRKNVTSWVFWRDLFNIHLIQGASVAALLLFLYFLFLFGTGKFKELKYLYFSLQCLFFALAYINITLYHDFIDEILMEKISRISFPLTVMFLALFIMEFIKILNKKIWIKFLIVFPTVILSFLTIFKNSKESIHELFKISMNFCITPILIFCIIMLIISALRDKKLDSTFILLAFLVVILTSIRDIYFQNKALIPYCWVVPYGYIVLVIGIFFILASEQSKIYVESVIRARELNIKNESLKKMMDNITLVSENIVRSSKNLEENVSATIFVIEKYGENNKIIIDKIIEQFEDIENAIIQITNRIDVYNEKIPPAIFNQTSVVEEVSATISNINTHIESTMQSAVESNDAAKYLSEIADKSTKIIIQSKESIDKISEYSNFINDVLNTIENITEKTNLLSINASIEAANSGEKGKGFSVIAGEIRKLSKKSKDSLISSFNKIKMMTDIIKLSTSLSDEVSKSLLTIVKKSKQSAKKINNITDQIKEQKHQSSSILEAVQSLLEDTITIKELSKEEQSDNEKIKLTLIDLKKSFIMVTDLLKKQSEKETELNSSINNIKEVMAENLKNVDILNESIVEL